MFNSLTKKHLSQRSESVLACKSKYLGALLILSLNVQLPDQLFYFSLIRSPQELCYSASQFRCTEAVIASAGECSLISMSFRIIRTYYCQHWHYAILHPIQIKLPFRYSKLRVPAETRHFSILHSVQTGSGAHSTAYPMRNRGFFFRG
jgi:hypothetical protein